MNYVEIASDQYGTFIAGVDAALGYPRTGAVSYAETPIPHPTDESKVTIPVEAELEPLVSGHVKYSYEQMKARGWFPGIVR